MPRRVLMIDDDDEPIVAELDACRIMEVPDDFEGFDEPLADDDDEGIPPEPEDFESVSLVEALRDEYRPDPAPDMHIPPARHLPPTDRDADEWPTTSQENGTNP